MKKILMLLMLLSMIGACQNDNSSGDGNPIIPIVPTDFYLGDGFTIDSIDGKSFISSDKSLTYTVDKITHISKTVANIKAELKTAIETVLNKNTGITYTLGEPISTPDAIGFGVELNIKFPVTINENSIDTKGEYSFTISFKDDILPWDGTSMVIPEISTDNNYYLIDNASNLAWLSGKTVDKNVRFTNDINMANKSFKGIKEFSGIFDGDNYTVKNLNIDRSSSTDTFALIEKITGDSTIKYLTLDTGKVTGANDTNINSDNISAFIGSITGTTENKIKIKIDNSTTNLGLTSDNSNNGASVYIGGFIAHIRYADISITNSKNLGSINNPNDGDAIYAGGIIGYSVDNSMIDISGSSNQGDITVTAIAIYAGGLIGSNIGDNSGNISIINTYNSGDISATRTPGTTTNETYSGGLIGKNDSHPLTIKTSYNYADIFGIKYGAIIGISTPAGTYENNFWYMPILPLDAATAGTELTVDTFKLKKTFTAKNWDFTNTWEILDGALYPTLKTNPNP